MSKSDAAIAELGEGAGKRKRGSRNKKKNMRKVDISDVDKALESARHDERTGLVWSRDVLHTEFSFGQTKGYHRISLFYSFLYLNANFPCPPPPLSLRHTHLYSGSLSDKPDTEIFFQDKSNGMPASGANGGGAVLGRKARARMKVLHADKALEANPHVKAVANRLNNPARKSKRRRVEAVAAEVKPAAKSDAPQGKEIWDAPAPEATVLDLNPWLEPEKVRQVPIKRPKRFGGKEKSLIPAVTVVSGGASYNPSFENHQKLLRGANASEEIVVQKKAEIAAKMPKRLTGPEKDLLVFQEFSVGFADDTDDESGSDNSDGEADDGPLVLSRNKPVKAEDRKTKQQKRRALLQKQKEKALREKKAHRLQQEEVYRLRSLMKELRQENNDAALRQAEKELKAQLALKVPRRLGPSKFKDRPEAIKLTDELVGSLRALKPESNLFHDRFASMQQRNLIEVRVPVKRRRRYKLKEYEKRSYKNYDLNRSLKKKEKHRLKLLQKKA